jgi:quercetin dioxygenase-like cupin family protein
MRSPISTAFVLAATVFACRDSGKSPGESSAPLTKEPPTPRGDRPAKTTNADTELARPVMVNLASVPWIDGPESLPKGAQVAVLEGAPPFPAGKTFSLLLKMPKQYTIPPHTHPSTERVTVLQGTLRFGHGVTLDKDTATAVERGGLISIPAGHVHYAFTGDEEAIIALHGLGPWNIFYVDPANDPRQPAPEKPSITRSQLEPDLHASIIAAKDITYTDPPPGLLPPGAKMAVLEGNPDEPKTFVIRLKFPDGYRVPVHSHTISDRFDVVQGELRFALGRKFDEEAVQPFGTGSVIIVPKRIEHYAIANGETVIQVFGVGPFDIAWSHPEDAPARPSSTE